MESFVMSKLWALFAALLVLTPLSAAQEGAGKDEPVEKNFLVPGERLVPVPASQVSVEGEFWAPRMAINREAAIPHQYRMLAETGRIENFRRAAKGEGKFEGLWFNDSDVYKWIEAAARSLVTKPDPDLEARVDELIGLIADAQEDAGYLNTYFQLEHPDKKWECLHMGHELYCAGHLIQAAVAYHEATGKDALLQVAQKFADLTCETFGEGKRRGAPGHECIEMGLVDLYRQTGEKRYLDLA